MEQHEQRPTEAVDRLIPAVYDELRDLARRIMSGERAGHTLQATALVHEAYVRLLDQRNVDPTDRTHFFAVAATTIRRILVDHAKRRSAAKRGGEGSRRVTIDDVHAPGPSGDVDLVALDDALEALAKLCPRAAEVVTLRYFGGMTVDEIAQSLRVSPRTVADDWAMARAWLRRQLAGANSPIGGRAA